jgi:hypothetical protein
MSRWHRIAAFCLAGDLPFATFNAKGFAGQDGILLGQGITQRACCPLPVAGA